MAKLNVEKVVDDSKLENYYLVPAICGWLHAEYGEREIAKLDYADAINRPCTEPEKRFLAMQIDDISN